MGTTYAGVAASLATGVSITVPADGDPDNAATFTVGTQKLADIAEALRQKNIPAPVSITPNTGWTVNGDCGYWKDGNGTVHLFGKLTNSSGAASSTNLADAANALPAGFRPSRDRAYALPCTTTSAVPTIHTIVVLGTTGGIGVAAFDSIPTAASVDLSGVSFRAEV